VVTADRLLVFMACGVRNLAYGMSSVILGVYLAGLGLSATVIGGVFTAALAGGALLTVGLSSVADRLGRRKIACVSAALMAASAAGFALADQPALLAIAAAFGAANPSGKEIGPFLSVEQAILPQVVKPEKRTVTFAIYNMVASYAGALGALAVGLPGLAGLQGTVAHRSLVWAYTGLAVLLLVLYTRFSPEVEVVPGPVQLGRRAHARGSMFGLGPSRGVVFRLAALFAADAFGGGFIVQSILAYWLVLRYGVNVAGLGAIFFATNVAAALSFLAAAPLARRIGLLNTMVFTHLPSNVLLLLVPLMPDVQWAVVVLVARYLLSQLDVPTRQSYTMAIVQPEERSAAAGFTSVARNASQALAPAFTGATLAVPAAGLPFIIGGCLKIVYDVAILLVFRKFRPPEEG
jgi:MFS family permease